MAIAPKNQSAQTLGIISFTQDSGISYGNIPTKIQTTTPPVPVPPILLGSDAIVFKAGDPATKSFPALIQRDVTQNPTNPSVSSQNTTLTVPTNCLAIFTAFAQGLGTSNVTLQTQAINSKNITVPGPFLGPETYYNFQVTIDNPDNVPVTIVGRLEYQTSTT